MLGQVLSTGTSWALNQFSGLSKSEREQNAFNANQAQIGRDFSAQQAEIERDWQEEMYSKYNSLQGQIDQAKQSGVNPMLAVTGSATSPMSASVGSPAAPVASGSASRGPNIDMVGAALGFSKLKAEIDNINASTRYQNGQALLAEIDSQTRGQVNEWNIQSIMQSIETSKADEQQKLQAIRESASRILNTDADTKVKSEQLALMGAQIADLNAGVDVKVAQLREISASISQMEAEASYKLALIPYVAAQTNSEKIMARLLTEQVGLTRSQRNEVNARVRQLYSDYDHKQIMYAFEEALTSVQFGNWENWVPTTEVGNGVKQFLRYMQGILNLGAFTSSSVGRTTSTSTSTVTTVDGNQPISRSRVGF